MARHFQLPQMAEEEALSRIIAWLRRSPHNETPVSSSYGHDLYIPNLIASVLDALRIEDQPRNLPGTMTSNDFDLISNSAPFYDGAWDLCRRGILRPSFTQGARQSQSSEILGAGFSLTSYGRKWLAELSGYEILPSEYGQIAQLLANHARRLGDGYYIRSQEAMSCYRAHIYLACCAMCGAAAESILLALAIAKKGSEDEVLNTYRSAHGRSKVEKMLTGQQTMSIQQDFTNYISLLKYWRDEAAHGTRSTIQEEEAFTSLVLLLRFAQFAETRWKELTEP